MSGDGSAELLAACQGFRLEAGGKRIGVVEEILFGDGGRPAALLVQGGLFGNRTYIVPVASVSEILPRAKRVLVDPATELDPA